MFKRNCQQLAFTLIEVLVVIAIIALLVAIVIPTLTRVKERARRTICQSNIRSFHIAVTAYAANYDDFVPQGGDKADLEVNDYIFLLDHEIHKSLTGDAHLSLVCPNPLNKPQKNLSLTSIFASPLERHWKPFSLK